jgi:hypothetical protein
MNIATPTPTGAAEMAQLELYLQSINGTKETASSSSNAGFMIVCIILIVVLLMLLFR